MANTISNLAHLEPQALKRHNNKNLEELAEKKVSSQSKIQNSQDTVTINSHQEAKVTYGSSLTVQTGDIQDQYTLLRGLVANMLKEQGIDFKIANGDQLIDISEISQDDAIELVSEDGYFGIEKTSDRIVDLAIAAAGGDTSKLAVIKEGVKKGFNEAMEIFGGSLPDISYDTYDAVMNKLDSWAGVESPERES
jgi:hypothetical protein